MHDIRLAIALIALLSVAVFSVTLRLMAGRSHRFLDGFAVVLVLLTVAYVQYVWGQLWIVRWIPLPSVIVLSNWFPLILGALAATVWLRLAPASVMRRIPVIAAMIAAGAYSVFYFIPQTPPTCENQWADPVPPLPWRVCLQTTKHTCSAAAAATILDTLGIQTTEQEMAHLCMTRRGTTWLGLYHGLSTKLLGTKFKVEFFETDLEGLQQLETSAPLLLCCELDPTVAEAIPEYVSEGGWIPGTAHSVVYFGTLRRRHIVGDPSRGYEAWTTEDLGLLWTGTGLKIRRRNQSAPTTTSSDTKPATVSTGNREPDEAWVASNLTTGDAACRPGDRSTLAAH